MNRSFIAFDIEISKEIPEGLSDWREVAPLGISCAATVCHTTEADPVTDHTFTWHGKEDPATGMLASKMSPSEVEGMFDYMYQMWRNGFDIVTWNGLGFDFPVMMDEMESETAKKVLVEMALGHYDIGFHMVCDKGYMISLNAAAEGIGIEGKTEGMKGSLAPAMWAESRYAQDMVLEYVEQDVVVTANIYKHMLTDARVIPWTAHSGRRNLWIYGRPYNVKEALAKKLPDTSWMTNPRPREAYYSWTGYEPH